MRDRKIEELEQQILIKEEILRKQSIMLADNEKCKDKQLHIISELRTALDVNEALLGSQRDVIKTLTDAQFTWHSVDEKPEESGNYFCVFSPEMYDDFVVPEIYRFGRYYKGEEKWDLAGVSEKFFKAWTKLPPCNLDNRKGDS